MNKKELLQDYVTTIVDAADSLSRAIHTLNERRCETSKLMNRDDATVMSLAYELGKQDHAMRLSSSHIAAQINVIRDAAEALSKLTKPESEPTKVVTTPYNGYEDKGGRY